MTNERLAHRLIIQDAATKRIRLTRYAIELFGPRFEKAGIDPSSIRTFDDWDAALTSSFAECLETVVGDIRGEDPNLDDILALLLHQD